MTDKEDGMITSVNRIKLDDWINTDTGWFKNISSEAIIEQEKCLINIIINIYNNKYSNYSEYVEAMKADVTVRDTGLFGIIPIMTEEIFNYLNTYKERLKQND